MLDYELEPGNVHVGPSDHVPWLTDRKFCYIQMEGTTYGDVPLRAELKLEVWDSPNSAGVITDAIRCLKLGLDRGLKGTLVAPSSYFMKSPPIRSRRHRLQSGRGLHPGRGQRDPGGHRGAGQEDVPADGRIQGEGRRLRQLGRR
jgi:myo-inositol-1-phosphate synthase